MDLFEKILTKEEINKRFNTAVTAIMVNKLISSKAGLAESLGVKPAKFSEILNGRMKVGIDMIAKMCDSYGVSPDWLLLSRGNEVFRRTIKPKIWIDDDDLSMNYIETEIPNSKNPEETKLRVTPNIPPIPLAEESIIYKMYKDEKEDWKVDKKEKEAKIEALQSELLSAKEELAAFKARYPEYPTVHPEGLGSSETAPHVHSHPHSPTSEHYYGGSLPPHQENQ